MPKVCLTHLKVVAAVTMYPPVVCTTPLGLPVDPEVYCPEPHHAIEQSCQHASFHKAAGPFRKESPCEWLWLCVYVYVSVYVYVYVYGSPG